MTAKQDNTESLHGSILLRSIGGGHASCVDNLHYYLKANDDGHVRSTRRAWESAVAHRVLDYVQRSRWAAA